MCGISGIYCFNGPDGAVLNSALIMNSKIRHRGPDGEGYLAWNGNAAPVSLFGNDTTDNVRASELHWSPKVAANGFTSAAQMVFGHRRLAIIDLAATGHQPMSYSNGDLWITYNGELYNYIELRKELLQSGYSFITQSDTEVILAAYKHWGESCVSRFNGMWAFVIWDRTEHKLFCSRDRFGVKPFYYFHDKNYFVFASELKALAACPVVKTGLNHEAVADYFVAGEIEYKPAGFFRNILELFPGNNIVIDLENHKLIIRKWYELKFTEAGATFTESETRQYVEQIREQLIEAIRIRLRSDVPVGSCLSGGIDSSAISGIISHLVKQDSSVNVGDKLKLFTAAFSGSAIDESKWAQLVVEQTQGSWYKVQPEAEELLMDLESLIYSQDVPIWSTSTYAQHRVMKLAADNGIRVLLDGQGGDELFAGYLPYFIPFWKELKKQGQHSRRKSEMEFWSGNVDKHRRKETLKQYIVPSLPVSVQLMLQKRYFPDLGYLSPELIAAYKTGYARHEIPSSLNHALSLEFVNTRLKGYLKCEDRCSMWHSVESRTPFADDHKLIESVFNIPGTLKIQNGTTKYLLREAVSGFIPSAIRNRKDKMGYVTPNNQWITALKGKLKPYFDQDFDGILDRGKLLREYDSLFDIRDKAENGRIFKFIAFAVWKKVYNL